MNNQEEDIPTISKEDEACKAGLLADKDQAQKWQMRRHDDWTDNYLLYRDKVITNRLTQRQTVNVPLMKSALKTILKDIDDPPSLYFNNLNNDTQKELFYNEYWHEVSKTNKLKIKDIQDKKNGLLYGRTFKKLNIVNGKFYFEIVDPQDMPVDRYVDPADFDGTAGFIIHQHIFRPLRRLMQNTFFDQAALLRLKAYFATKNGFVATTDQNSSQVDANQRMEKMGAFDINNPMLGETIVELSEFFRKEWDEKLKRDIIYWTVMAEDAEVLYRKPLYQIIGDTQDHYWYDHFPITTWGEDVERTDVWNDGPADILRSPNKILNVWLSQLVENRTMRNFGMNFYNSNLGFQPQTYTPVPFGWYPIPIPEGGRLADAYQHVEIPKLEDTLQDVQFIITMAEKATAATSQQQGQAQPQKLTLGEVQMLVANAQDRVKAMSPLYTDSWEEFGIKYSKILDAAPNLLDAMMVYKKGRQGKSIYARLVKPEDWQDNDGYITEVKDTTQDGDKDIQDMQKLNVPKTLMPNNPVLNEIIKQKSLEMCSFSATQIEEIMKIEKQPVAPPVINPMDQNGGMPNGSTVTPTQLPVATA
jgi:hypothetical protein